MSGRDILKGGIYQEFGPLLLLNRYLAGRRIFEISSPMAEIPEYEKGLADYWTA